MTSENQLKIVLAGCGSISRTWVESAIAYPGLEFVGLVDLNPDNAHKVQEEFQLGQIRLGDDLEELLETTEANIVFDCTVPEAHKNITVAALKRGCHVLGEKPMADSMENAAIMLETVRNSGKIYAVVQNRRYVNSIVRFHDLIGSRAIGDLTTLNADFYLGCHFGGFRDEMEHVLLLDMAIHSFDQARYISDTDPLTVYCYEWNPASSWYRQGASAMAIFEMSNGVVFNYRGSWCAEGENTPWECAWRAVGEKGTALWDGGDGISAEIAIGAEGFIRKTQKLEIPKSPKLEHIEHKGVIYEFLDCVKNGGTPQTICTDNIKSLAMVHAAIESAITGKKVKIQL